LLKDSLGNLFKEFLCIFYGLGASIGVKRKGSSNGFPLKGCLWMGEDGGQDDGENASMQQHKPCSTPEPCNR